ncbi:MAG: hypothetical protein ABSH44_19250 [Bryobacteraceae bacterium]|jgi:mRNA-degrading endonuclease RelE of RelBE toxin-antitoxin system
MKGDPFSGDLARLHGQPGGWRRRAGAYRIFFDVDYGQRLVIVTAIVRRTSTTY